MQNDVFSVEKMDLTVDIFILSVDSKYYQETSCQGHYTSWKHSVHIPETP